MHRLNIRLSVRAVVFSLAVAALGPAPAGGAGAQSGVSASEILIGQCAALSGPAEGLGNSVHAGLKAAFDEANAKGGVHGRQIRLLVADDGYEPEKSVDCTGSMIEDKGVFALAGYVGTPTAKVVAPMVQEYKVPLVGLFTGADLLRNPVQRYVINIRASYDDETEALIEYLRTKGFSKIAVLYQNDSFGLSVLEGVEKALARRKITLAGKGSFERNTLDVRAGLTAILGSTPDAVVIGGPYEPAAAFVKAAGEAGMKAQFAAISFVGTESLIAKLGAAANGTIVTQVVPSPVDASVSLSRDYLASLKKSDPSAAPSYPSFEGYVGGRILVSALDMAGKDVTREKLIDSFHGMSRLEMGGMTFSFSESNHQGSKAVYVTVIADGKAQLVK